MSTNPSTYNPAIAESPAGSLLWYAVHTRSRHEKKIASELERKGIPVLLPLYEQSRQWSDRRMIIQVPLFSCYVFVQIPLSIQKRVDVLQTAGVLRFVGGNDLGVSIPEREIENIQLLLERKLAFAPHPFLEVGQRVRIRGGALDGIEGLLSRFAGSNRLVLSVQTIQRSLSVTVDGYDVEPLESRRTPLESCVN